MPKHEIVFEDLRGAPEDSLVVTEVDLDKDNERFGIKQLQNDQSKQAKKGDDDKEGGKDEFEDLPGDYDDDREPDNAARDDDAEDDEEKEDEGDYSGRVRKRIERERRAKLKAAEERDYWKGKAEEATKQLSESRRASSERTVKAIDEQITATENALEDAIENGKTSDQVKLTSRLTDLKAERITTQLSREDDSSTDTVDKGDEGGKVPGKRSEGNPLVNKWMRSNADWYGKRGFERQTRIANRLDREVYEEGFSTDDPEYFKELDRRLKDKIPEVFDEEPRRKGSSRSVVAPVGGAEDERPIRRAGNKVDITGEDRATMVKFGLDPNDPEALREFARNKREAEADERRSTRSRS